MERDDKKNVTFDMSIEYSTGETCVKDGWYLCKYHPYIEKWVNSDEEFPRCHKANCGRTEWYLITSK